MADENTPAFYPRVGRNIAKNFRSAQPAPFVNDPRAMDLPQYGDIDLSQPTKSNLEMGRRMAERDAQLKRQQSADTSPLEKAAGALQAVRLMGSALTQSINSLPTRLVHGDKAAEKFMEERMYKPEQPLAYEYAGDVGNFLEKLETEYKLPPMLPEAVALQYLTGPATSQAMRTAGRGAEQVGRKLESAMEPVVKGALERGGLPREMVMAMGQGTQSNIMKREGGNWLNNLTDPSLERLKITTRANNDPAEALRQVRERFTPEAIEALPENSRPNVINSIAQLERDVALNNWIDSNLSRYVKNEMGTPSDPIRLLIEKREDEINAKFALDQQRAQRIADRAEAEPDPRRKANLTRQSAQMMEDAEMNRDMAMKHKSHLPSDLQNPDTMWTPEYLAETRKRQGFPEEETGKTKSSQMWEQMADETIYPANVGEIQRHPANMERRAEAYLKLADFEAKVDQKLRDKFLKAGVDEDVLNRYLQNTLVTEKADVVGESELGRKLFNDVGSLPSNLQFLDEASSKNPWISKLDPKDTVYSGNVGGLNFDHVLDVLKEDLAAGRIRPEQLNKMSMEQAVRRTAEYDLELAKKMNADRASARADLPVYKEYPEGYKWVQLNRPSDFAAESDAMGHSVRGYEPPRGHPDWTDASGDYGYSSYGLGGWDAIKSGDAKVYSLVDAKGEPHVTIEVGKNRKQLSRDDLLPYREAALEEAKKLPNGYTDYDLNDIEIRMARENLPPYIKQIKGKGNDRPINKYDPYTQDFVTGGNWEFVDDLQNTGLKPIDKVPERARFESAGMKLPKYLTDAEHENLINEYMKLTSHPPDLDFMHKAYGFPKPDVPPDLEGMKRGGKVSISNNPDTMMLELNNQKMKNGVPAYSGAGAIIKQGLKAGRMSRAEAEAAGLYHPVGVGVKLRRPVSEIDYKAVLNPDQPMVPERKVTPEALYKGAGIPLVGDSSRAGELITEIAGKKLEKPVELQGGMNFMRVNTFKDKPNKSASWASGTSVISDLNKKARIAADQAEEVYGLHTSMSPSGADFSSMPTKILLAQFNPKAHDPVILDALDEEIRKLKPKFVGVRSPDLEQQLLGPGGGEMRKAFVTRLALKPFQDAGLPNVAEARYMVSHPDLLDQPVGTVGCTIAKIDPRGTVIEDPVNVHYDYPSKQGGEYFAGFDVPMTTQEVFPEFFENRRAFNADKAGDRRAFDLSTPIQVFDQKWLDQVMPAYLKRRQELIGKKKGGAVHKAAGGAVTGDDLILEERPL